MSGSPAVPLVTLARAKRNLKLPPPAEGSPIPEEDLDVQEILDAATDIIRDYLARPEDQDWSATMASWDRANVPPTVAAAILQQTTELYRFRGDDLALPPREAGSLSPTIKAILARLRDPVCR